MDDDRLTADRAADAALVERIRSGDESAFGALYDRWIDRTYDLACRIVGADEAADVAHDAFLLAWRNLDSLRDPAAFGGWLLRSARNAALTRRERAHRTSATDTEGLAVIEASGPSDRGAPAGFRIEDRLGTADDPARAVEDGETVTLVWDAAAALGERDTAVLDLTLRHGLTPAEVGEVVGVNRNAANQLVHRVRNRLGDAIRAKVLWRGGEPHCADLAADLAEAGVERFGPDAVRVAIAHAGHCDACDERRRLRLAPVALFSAVPLVGAPALAHERVAAALAADGVPMGGSSAMAEGSEPGVGSSEPVESTARAVSVPVESTARAVSVPAESTAPAVSVPRADRSAWKRHRAKVAAAVCVLALLAAGAWIASSRDGEGDAAVAITAATTTTTSSSTTTTTTTTPEVAPSTSPAEAPSGTDPPAVLPPPPIAPPPEVSVRITEGPLESVYTRETAPRLVWSVVGGAVVAVTGPNFPASDAASGDEPLCPTEPPGWTVCPYATGAWTYRVRVFDAAGVLVAEETAVLTRD